MGILLKKEKNSDDQQIFETLFLVFLPLTFLSAYIHKLYSPRSINNRKASEEFT
jgi:hypothetical protein